MVLLLYPRLRAHAGLGSVEGEYLFFTFLLFFAIFFFLLAVADRSLSLQGGDDLEEEEWNMGKIQRYSTVHTRSIHTNT